MGPIELFKLLSDYGKAKAIAKEKAPMSVKIAQYTTLATTVVGLFAGYLTGWLNAHPEAFTVLSGAAVVLAHAFPSIFATPPATTQQNTTAGKLGSFLLVLGLTGMLCCPARAQTVAYPASTEAPAPAAATATTTAPASPANLYAAGVAYNPGASPSVAGTALYAHEVGTSGTYAFTAVDALPESLKPFTVTTNVGAGIAQKVATLDGVAIFAPTSAGISWSGGNTGWQWTGGGIAAIPVRTNYYILPSLRFLKSSVSGGSGYQLIAGIAFGGGK